MLRTSTPCPRCGHPLDCHNDTGTFGGGQGAMRCYYNDSEERTGTYRQFESSGEPVACGCSYDGPGTERVLLMPPRKPTPDEMRQGLNDIKNVLPMAAELMRSYYLQLLEQGFDASEAIVLTTAMQTALLQGGGQQ